ncbi:MAG: primosomal protein N' [Bacillota bacterium]|nr:primosomal protein N' [Bacillota bacterium]
MALYAQVFLRQARPSFDRLYDYLVPPPLAGVIRPGMQVLVPFGRGDGLRPAFVRRLLDEPSGTAGRGQLKSIDSLVENFPLLREDQLELCEHMAIRYATTRGEAARLMIPALTEEAAGPGGGRVRHVSLTDREAAIALLENGDVTHVNQIRIMEFLLDAEAPVDVHDLLTACQLTESTITTLRKKGWIETSWLTEEPEEEPGRAVAAGGGGGTVLSLTEGQREALGVLTAAYERRREEGPRVREYLLQGVTGSGKTEVYLRLAETVVRAGQGVIILVPEIGLTPQMSERIESFFGGQVAIQHSRLTPRERQRQWELIRSGQVQVVVGARSAVFSPLENIGLIVIDEEQESTYRSDRNPRYDARSVARLRVRDRAALLLLGSATPSLESRRRCDRGLSQLLRIGERPAGARLPSVRVVDLRRLAPGATDGLFSPVLRQAMEEVFDRGEQVMLFHNRRGWSGLEICSSCGAAVECQACSVAMTLHLGRHGRPDRLECHYCGLTHAVPQLCPNCGEPALAPRGFGTEQIESIFRETFPERRILRMDQDTTTGRGSHASILGAFRRREADCLLGTQMIAKGHDFPDVTLVGVLLADLLFQGNDFHASERGFQLLTQAAGRAGRADRPGHVIIQAFAVDHEALNRAVAQDYEGFYRQELRFREQLGYPPYSTMGTITVSHSSDAFAERATWAIREELVRQARRAGLVALRILPPAPAMIRRINNRSRWQLHLTSPLTRDIAWLFRIAAGLRLERGTAIGLSMDPA